MTEPKSQRCDGCRKVTESQPLRKPKKGEKWLCFGCALSFAVYSEQHGGGYPYA